MSDLTLHGRQIDISEDRYVWMGKHEGNTMICFSTAGRQTKIALSPEATEALLNLLILDLKDQSASEVPSND